MALVASSARAQAPESISVLGTGLATSLASVTCPDGTDNCALNTISGPISKAINSYTSAGTLSVTLYSDQSAGSVLKGPNTNDCHATEGSASISNATGTNILKFNIYGLICESSIVGCGAGPLSLSVRAASEPLRPRREPGPSTFSPNHVSIFPTRR
jgi:hypothetical protein